MPAGAPSSRLAVISSRSTEIPAAVETKEIAHQSYDHGLITITAGTYNDIMRAFVPLMITYEQIDEALDVWEAAITSVAKRKGTAVFHAVIGALLPK